uniref:RRM domain-containing protein n=1 Tax=Setaria digitata TaxID=48799 RepID=A0A915PLB0_9BILA
MLEFFAEGENGCKVTDGGILFVNKSDGRPTGDAFVMFDNEEAGQKALTKHKHTIGTRSTQAEVQQVVNRNLENGQRMTIHGSKKDCIRLRGLPYEAHVENIVEFLGETARHIMFQVAEELLVDGLCQVFLQIEFVGLEE